MHRFIIAALAGAVLSGCGYSHLSRGDSQSLATLPEKVLSEKALNFFNAAEYRKAADVYQLVLAKPKPDAKYAAWATYEIGYCHYYMAEYAVARTWFEKTVREFPGKEFDAPRALAEKLLDKLKRGKLEGI